MSLVGFVHTGYYHNTICFFVDTSSFICCFVLGSVVGSSIAYFVKEQQNKLNVMIVEPDCSYAITSTLLSVGGMF